MVRRRPFVFASALAILSGTFAIQRAPAKSESDSPGLPFPRLANYFLGGPWPVLQDLAKWDLVILKLDHADAATSIKQMNPGLKILAYLASEETSRPGSGPTDPSSGFSPNWWLRHSDGSNVTGWGGNLLINVTRVSPDVNGIHWPDHLASWIADRLAGDAVWDGVYYDNSWPTIDWKSTDLDLQLSGKNDIETYGRHWVNERWNEGMLDLMRGTRERLGTGAIVMGNGPLRATEFNNGRLFESFPNEWNPIYHSGGWTTATQDYWEWHHSRFSNLYYVIAANPSNNGGGFDDFQRMRFGLASSLLGDGYFAFDQGISNHAQVWWYDEYSVDLTSRRATGDVSRKGYLGQPMAVATQLKNGVWRRDFAQGVALVNPTDSRQVIGLERPFGHILGTQDPVTNDGSTVSWVAVSSHDGLILLNPQS